MDFIALPNGDYARKDFVAAVRKEQGDGDWTVTVDLGSEMFTSFEHSVSYHADEAAANAAMVDFKTALMTA